MRPKGQRLGILTHPSWLVSHSDAMDNHAILRGRWIRERLLGGGIPDVPITVDAMLPDEPHNTLRERMRVTKESYCWTCHEKMDPLGLPFEMYNHAGLFRTTELEKPVDTTGEIIDSGDPALDGKVGNAIEMIQKLAESKLASNRSSSAMPSVSGWAATRPSTTRRSCKTPIAPTRRAAAA